MIKTYRLIEIERMTGKETPGELYKLEEKDVIPTQIRLSSPKTICMLKEVEGQ